MADSAKTEIEPALAALVRALEAWTTQDRIQPLEAWLQKETDQEGTPIRMTVPTWWESLRLLSEARTGRKDWPRRLDEPFLGLTRAMLRFAQPDGSPTLGTDREESITEAQALLRQILELYPKSPEARVIAWVLRRPVPNHAPPPLPAWNADGRVLSVLRTDWRTSGDSLVVDQRQRSPVAGIELIGSGIRWLGPSWKLLQTGESCAPGKPVYWHSSSVADLAEWSYQANGLRMGRTALVLRGLKLALLAEQVNAGKGGIASLEARFGLCQGVQCEQLEESRGIRLARQDERKSAQVLPLSLPAIPYETDRGQFRFEPEGHSLGLRITPQGRRCWLPLLISWEPRRHRKRLSWRQLTVSEDGSVCVPEKAFAVRVSWGREETIVIYRSLGAPALRAFLGHQTTARFLVGRFTSEGVVEPIVTVDE